MPGATAPAKAPTPGSEVATVQFSAAPRAGTASVQGVIVTSGCPRSRLGE
jgi:hypothetical protein